tara:strand:+ start:1290 stop:1625 length:336 start_codon:yes stop_codon:yes gene_type:complete
MQNQQAEDNMKEYNFDSPADFKGVFGSNNKDITDSIVEAIQEANKFQKESAEMFSIRFGEEDIAYEITLPKSQWEKALTKCLENYHKWECADLAIDTYLLQKEIKKWVTLE